MKSQVSAITTSILYFHLEIYMFLAWEDCVLFRAGAQLTYVDHIYIFCKCRIVPGRRKAKWCIIDITYNKLKLHAHIKQLDELLQQSSGYGTNINGSFLCTHK